jgi:hypothetical protein
MSRTCLEKEPHKNSKIFKKSPSSGKMISLEMYEYRLPLGTNIYEIYDSKDNTHKMPHEGKNS